MLRHPARSTRVDEPKFRSKPHKIIRNMLSELIFNCKNLQYGCTEEVKYDNLSEHEEYCEFEMMKCSGASDGCNAQLIKKEMKQHEKSCSLVPVLCEYCKKKVKRSGIKAHWMYCEEAELSCEFCSGIFKKKNYLIHVNALCEEYIMNCGRCSGTFKRKYKEFHDCIRHLQNCQKTMGEEISSLREKLIEKDKKICELENRVFFELSDLKLMVQKLKEQSNGGDIGTSRHSRISSIADSNGFQQELLQQNLPLFPKWSIADQTLFSIQDDQKTAVFQLDVVQSQFQSDEIVFGYVHTECPMMQSNMIEIEIQQNMTTNFIPMYYIIGAVSFKDLQQLKSLDTFDSIYYLLSPTCCFLPSFGKSFCDKMKYSLRKTKPLPLLGSSQSSMTNVNRDSSTLILASQTNAINLSESQFPFYQHQDHNQAQVLMVNSLQQQSTSLQTEVKLEIEEIEKNQKQKVVILDSEVFVFFGLFCSQSTHLLNHKEIKVKIY